MHRGLAGVAVLAIAVVAAPLLLPSRPDQAAPPEAVAPAAEAPAYQVTQAVNCETPAGVCQLPAPQPVGSLCQCPGGATGRAIL
jgi:hypothetical protein